MKYFVFLTIHYVQFNYNVCTNLYAYFQKKLRSLIFSSLFSSPLIFFIIIIIIMFSSIIGFFFTKKVLIFFIQLTNVLIYPIPSLMLQWQLMHFPAHCHGPSSRKQIQLNVIIELDVMAIVPVASLAIVPML